MQGLLSVHCAGLSDFSERGAVRRHFSRQVARSSFAGSSDGKMNVQSACALNTLRVYYSICFWVTIFSNVTPCSVIERYQRFGEPAALVLFWCCAGKYAIEERGPLLCNLSRNISLRYAYVCLQGILNRNCTSHDLFMFIIKVNKIGKDIPVTGHGSP
jgi:hypothetical protein